MFRAAFPLLLLSILSACGGGTPEKPLQDRNGPCARDRDCLPGLTCEGATRQATGTCQALCTRDSDCGNGALCRSGQCKKDCAEVGEKCSDHRVCCFFDENGDKETDSRCVRGASGDERCTVGAPPPKAP